jgi:regulator of protease activity HflC (stomatin/prohibitin superfamily)
VNLVNIVSFLAVIAWAIVLGVLALVIVRSTRGKPLRSGWAMLIVAILFAVALNVLAAGMVFIQPSERGVVVSITEGGIRNQPLQPGLHWVLPFAEHVVHYSISRETYTMSVIPEESDVVRDDVVESRTSDGQVVHVDASVIFSIDPNRVNDIHIRWQDRYRNALIRPVVRGVIRDAVSQFQIDEIYSTKRLEVAEFITNELETTFNENGLVLVQFVLRNIAFSDEYAASVEQKQIAEQLAQQAAFVVDQRRQEAEQARQVAQGQADAAVIIAQGEAESRLIQAEAESEALAMLAAAIAQNPDILTLEYIQKLSPNIQVMLVPADNPFLLPFPGSNP